MTEDYVIDVRDLNKSFNGKPAVVNLSLQVKKGEIFGFLGPNGSGKTTTIRMLCGLMTPDSGSGKCLGYDIVRESRKIKPLVGYVPQYFSLYQDLTVQENLEFVARVYEEPDIKTSVHHIMTDLGLDNYKSILAGRLSGGWKQRLSLGAALIHHPKLLLLDEPTAGVDPKARREFWNYISHLTSEGITSLVSTHYMDEAEHCNRLAYIVYGHIMAEGTIPQIIKHAGLISWETTGKNLVQLEMEIENQAGIDQVVIWGNELRISGTNAKLMQQTMAKFSNYQWREVRTSLEEVFIHLVREEAEEKTK